jgi:PhnB protein
LEETPMPTAEQQGPTGGLTPHLVVSSAAKAIDFYKKAFGAREVVRMPAEDGKRVMHAHLHINGASLMLADDFPEFHGGKATPPPSAVTLHLQVDDADAWFARAAKAGAKATMPLQDMFWGDRYGQVMDPFGHRWSIAAAVKRAAKAPAKAPAKAAAKAPATSPAKAPVKKAAAKKR